MRPVMLDSTLLHCTGGTGSAAIRAPSAHMSPLRTQRAVRHARVPDGALLHPAAARRNWIRIPGIIYGSFVVATMVPILTVLATHQTPGYDPAVVTGGCPACRVRAPCCVSRPSPAQRAGVLRAAHRHAFPRAPTSAHCPLMAHAM